MNMSSKKAKLILWAFDPFEKTTTINQKTINEFSDLLKKSNAIIEPVHVAYKSSINGVDLDAAIGEHLKKFALTMRPPRIIRCAASASKAVNALVEYANACGADLIVVTSHGRQGLARMTFGSFAEALLTSSKVPLYFLNRHPKPDYSKSNTALFATDFSRHCEQAFTHFLKLASGIVDEVIIYHDMNFIYEMAAYGTMYGLDFPVSQDFVDEQIEWVQQEARKWVDKAQRRGFRATSVIQEKYDVSRSILNEAKVRGAGLIVLASQSGPMSSIILGSHARIVFRAGEIPVLVYGPQNGPRQVTRPAEQQQAL
jgi:nucleotide-binding universal stress UspA family protein